MIRKPWCRQAFGYLAFDVRNIRPFVLSRESVKVN